MTFSDYDTEAGPLLNILGWKTSLASKKDGLAPDYLKTKFRSGTSSNVYPKGFWKQTKSAFSTHKLLLK